MTSKFVNNEVCLRWRLGRPSKSHNCVYQFGVSVFNRRAVSIHIGQ